MMASQLSNTAIVLLLARSYFYLMINVGAGISYGYVGPWLTCGSGRVPPGNTWEEKPCRSRL